MKKFDFSHANNESVMPFYAHQAFNFSYAYAERYLVEHASEKSRFDNDSASVMACSRLEWILNETRKELSGRFTEQQIELLLNCFQAEIFFPDQFNDIASSLCEDLGIEFDEYQQHPIGPFINELRELSPAQRVTLADALEQTWYRGLPSGKGVAEFLEELGLKLAPN